MNTAVHKGIAWGASLLLLASAAFAAWRSEPAWLLLAPGLLGIYLLLQYPRWLLYLLLAAIPWSIEYNFTPSLGTDLPDEPLMLLASGAVLLCLIWKRKELPPLRSLHPLLWILALELFWILIAVLSSTDVVLSLKYLAAKGWYLLAFVAAPLLFLRNEKHLREAAGGLLASMLLFTSLALVRHGQRGFTFEATNESLQPFYRNHVNYSALLVCTVPLQIAALRLSRQRWLRSLLILTLVMTLGALYLSYARGAWLALCTGLAAYWLLRRRLLFISFVLASALSVAAVFYLSANDRYLKFSGDYRSTIFHTNFREHLIATYQLKDMSNAERIYRWVAGVRMVPESWKTGLGPSSFYHQYKGYTVPAFKTWVSANTEQSTVHNYFLLLLIEQGVAGLLLFLLLTGGMFWYIERDYHGTGDAFRRRALAALASILMMVCTVNFLSDLIETDKIGSIYYLCLAGILLIRGLALRDES